MWWKKRSVKNSFHVLLKAHEKLLQKQENWGINELLRLPCQYHLWWVSAISRVEAGWLSPEVLSRFFDLISSFLFCSYSFSANVYKDSLHFDLRASSSPEVVTSSLSYIVQLFGKSHPSLSSELHIFVLIPKSTHLISLLSLVVLNSSSHVKTNRYIFPQSLDNTDLDHLFLITISTLPWTSYLLFCFYLYLPHRLLSFSPVLLGNFTHSSLSFLF